jgi:Concanavalin A-like lectin/glucanases superfamily
VALTTAKVEFSQDDLSDTTPSWTDVTTYTKSVTWFSGKTSDLDPPQAGGATIVLNNQDRRFEPDYSAGAYSPNIKPLRRFRLTMTADGTAHTQGIYYASSWSVGYPARTTYSDVTVTCTDGIGILSLDTLPTLSPPDAQTYSDVVMADNPFAYYPLNVVNGRKMQPAVGPDGQFKGDVTLPVQSPVVSEMSAVSFGPNGYGKAPLDDVGVFHDSAAFTIEVVITKTQAPATTQQRLITGPYDTPSGTPTFAIQIQTGSTVVAFVTTQTGTAFSITSPGTLTDGTDHHLAATFDGGLLTLYIDGAAVVNNSGADNVVTPDTGESLYVGNDPNQAAFPTSAACVVAHAAFYDYALSADRVAAHYDAALNLGYATQTTGDRVADVATNALWDTSGITGGQLISVAPRSQAGQGKFSEITLVAQAEQPYGLFYFDDSGNPAYQGYDYDATSAATFSDSGSDVVYDGITLVYDDDLYNNVTIARDGGDAQTHVDAASESAYMTRGYNQTGLILSTDSDADLVSAGVLDAFNAPRIRVAAISLNGGTQTARAQILTREIGDTIRVKRRTDTGEAIDVITRILGKQKSITPDGLIHCTWNLARGIDASDAHWHLGITGFSELNSTTILA